MNECVVVHYTYIRDRRDGGRGELIHYTRASGRRGDGRCVMVHYTLL